MCSKQVLFNKLLILTCIYFQEHQELDNASQDKLADSSIDDSSDLDDDLNELSLSIMRQSRTIKPPNVKKPFSCKSSLKKYKDTFEMDVSFSDSDNDPDFKPSTCSFSSDSDEYETYTVRKRHVSSSQDSGIPKKLAKYQKGTSTGEFSSKPYTPAQEKEIAVKSNLYTGKKEIEKTERYMNNDIHPRSSSPKIYATDRPDIYFVPVEKSNFNKRGTSKLHPKVANKLFPCPFTCKDRKQNFQQHIISGLHKKEPVVQEILKLDENSKERKDKIAILRNEAITKWNITVLKTGGELILTRRSTTSDTDFKCSDYGPCPYCSIWILRSLMKRHQRMCPASKIDCDAKSATAGDLMTLSDIIAGRIPVEASEELKNEVFKIMKSDHISSVAKSDDLIVQLGNSWMRRNVGNKAMRKYYTSSIMRLAARLLIELRKLQVDEDLKRSLSFFEACRPDNYKHFITAVLQTCGPIDDDLTSPSNAIKLSYDIRRLAEMKMSRAMDDTDTERGDRRRKEAKRFLTKMQISWCIDVKKLAKHVLSERQLNTRVELPDPGRETTLSRIFLSYPNHQPV